MLLPCLQHFHIRTASNLLILRNSEYKPCAYLFSYRIKNTCLLIFLFILPLFLHSISRIISYSHRFFSSSSLFFSSYSFSSLSISSNSLSHLLLLYQLYNFILYISSKIIKLKFIDKIIRILFLSNNIKVVRNN
ncbi:unnamed protein product [Meloidogyne enterolobii]|uniref:Uncharacterized protein n=1 Tax=Meloidogyne enterolobii TaxID=390850 RepID=A0ACB1AFR7_MELEN